MDDLIAFLRARLDEDADLALTASPGPWRPDEEHDEVLAVDDIVVAEGFALSGRQLRATVDHIARHDPARALAEIDAKRRILALHEPVILRAGGGAEHFNTTRVCRSCEPPKQFPEAAYPCDTIRLLALPYADHPEYQDAWRP